MLTRTVARHGPLWPDALAAATRVAPGTSSAQWDRFFARLQLSPDRGHDKDAAAAASTVSETRFDSVPAPLLRSIAQNWVDAWVLIATSNRLAQVYPPARAALPPTSSSSSPLPSAAGEAELLLASWSAHMLLASLHERQHLGCSPAAVPNSTTPSVPHVSKALAECLRVDVGPVLGYLTSHGATSASPARVLQRALVLLLASFVSAWRLPATRDVPQPPVSSAELTLAQELCQCIEALRGHVSGGTGTADTRRSDFTATSEAYYAVVRATLAEVTSHGADGGVRPAAREATSNGNGSDSEASLWEASQACIAEHRATASPFLGITGVPRIPEESPALLDHVSRQLSTIAQSSRGREPA